MPVGVYVAGSRPPQAGFPFRGAPCGRKPLDQEMPSARQLLGKCVLSRPCPCSLWESAPFWKFGAASKGDTYGHEERAPWASPAPVWNFDAELLTIRIRISPHCRRWTSLACEGSWPSQQAQKAGLQTCHQRNPCVNMSLAQASPWQSLSVQSWPNQSQTQGSSSSSMSCAVLSAYSCACQPPALSARLSLSAWRCRKRTVAKSSHETGQSSQGACVPATWECRLSRVQVQALQLLAAAPGPSIGALQLRHWRPTGSV